MEIQTSVVLEELFRNSIVLHKGLLKNTTGLESFEALLRWFSNALISNAKLSDAFSNLLLNTKAYNWQGLTKQFGVEVSFPVLDK